MYSNGIYRCVFLLYCGRFSAILLLHRYKCAVSESDVAAAVTADNLLTKLTVLLREPSHHELSEHASLSSIHISVIVVNNYSRI